MLKLLLVLSCTVSISAMNVDLLIKAAADGSRDIVEELLSTDKALTANSRDSLGRTALHCASERGHGKVVQLLIKQGAQVNAHAPIDKKGLKKLAKILAHRGYMVTCRTVTPLHLAAFNGESEVVALLLAAHAKVNAIGICNRMPLHEAVQQDHYATALILLNHKADVSARSFQGFTPLHLASLSASPRMISLLIERGASPADKDNDGATALHMASLAGRPDIVLRLLDGGASPVARTSLGLTPLHSVAAGKSADEIVMRIGEDASLEPCVSKKSCEGHLQVIQILLSKGARILQLDALEQTPLHIAAFFNNACLAEAFLAALAYDEIIKDSSDAYLKTIALLCSFNRLGTEGLPLDIVLAILSSTQDIRILVCKALVYKATPDNYLKTLRKRRLKLMRRPILIKTLCDLCGPSIYAFCNTYSLAGKTASSIAFEEGHEHIGHELNPENLEARLPNIISRWLSERGDVRVAL